MAEIKKISTELQLLDKFLDTSGDAGTSGQVLSSTATGINWIDGSAIPGGGGTVKGSGTLRTIPMWTPDGTTLGNSVLKQDVANQNIGIGITPETGMVTYVTQLRIGEQSALQGHTDGVGADSFTCVTTNLKFTSTGAKFINGTVAAPGFAMKYQQQTGDHTFTCSTASGVADGAITERMQMVIKQSGKVGIGSTSPLAPLHVVTPAVAGIDLTDISRTANNLVRFTNPQYSTSATMGLLLRVFPDSDARQGSGLLMTGGSDNAASNLSLFVSKDDGSGNNISKSYSALHIAGNTSNVGIGTTSPRAKLEVVNTGNYESIRITNSIVSNVNKQSGITTSNYVGNSTSIFQYATTTSNNSLYYGSADGSFRGITKHFFYVSSGANTVSHSLEMQITSGEVIVPGKVGIGLTDPVLKLDVQGTASSPTPFGSAAINGVVRIASGSTNPILDIGSNSAAPYEMWLQAHVPANTYGTPISLQPLGGNVGIGTNSPLSLFHIASTNPILTIQDTDATANFNRTEFQISGGSLLFNTRQSNGTFVSTDYLQSKNATGAITHQWFISGTEKMRINGSGNVGINDTSPDFKLDVGGTFGVSDLPFNTGSVSVLVANEIIGAELITNGNFSANSGWGVGSGWTIANGKASVDTASTVGLTQSISVVSGNVYKVSIEVSDYTSGSLQPQFGGSQVIASIGANGKYVYTVTSTVTNPVFYLYAVGDAEFSVDNASVKQVTSASDQIQKRELSSDAFGPGNGPYLPLSAGSSFPLTGDLYTGTNAINTRRLNINSFAAGAGLVMNYGNATGTVEFISLQSNGVTSPIKLQMRQSPSESDLILAGSSGIGLTLTSGSNALFAGNVGIGITTPSSKLQLRGNVTTLGDARYNVRLEDDTAMAQGVGAGVVFAGRYITNNTTPTTFACIWSEKENATSNEYGGELHLGTRVNNGGISSDLVINSSGNVGIGEDNPTEKLHLQSTTSGCFIRFADDTADGVYVGSRANVLELYAGNTERMRINSNGNVTIGATTSNRRLRVVDDGQANGSQNITAEFANSTSGATSSAIYIGSTTGTDWLIGKNIYGVSSQFYFQIGNQSGNTPAVTVATNNNVGIGTISPNEKLDVNGVVVISPNTDGKETFRFTTGSLDDARLFMKSDTTVKVDIQANGLSYFNGGNVGIGTTSNTTHKLIVSGGSNIASFRSEGTGQNLKKLSISTGGDRVVLDASTTTDTTAAFAFQTGGVERMRISDLGAIKFNTYGAGTLVSDASGNITASSGGGAGGPYLPLAGGTMTGTSGIEFPEQFKLKWKNSTTSTEVFSITSTGGTNSIVSGDGTNSIKTKIFVGDGGLEINSNDPTGLIADFNYSGISLRQSNVEQLATTSSGISVKGGDKGQPGYTFIGDTNTGMYSDTANQLEFVTGGGVALVIDSNQSVKVRSSSLQISSDNANFVTLTESGNGDFTIDAPDDIRLDAGGGDVVLRVASVEYGRLSKSSNDLSITSSITNSDILINPSGTGKVGIGNTSPGNKLEVTGIIEATVGDTGGFAYGADPATKQGLMISVSNTGGDGFSGAGRIENTSTTNSSSAVLVLRQTNSASFSTITQYRQGSGTQGNLVGFVRVTTTNTIFSTSGSDERLKKNITNWTDDTLGKFKALQPKKFRYKIQDASEEKTTGFIAQNEVANFPEAYVLNKENEDDDAMYSFNPMGMTTHLMKAIKDLVEKVETLENKITQLENNN